MLESSHSFIEFPGHSAMLDKLRAIEVADAGMEPMFDLVAGRLAAAAYDRSAFVFILLELIYEFEQDTITFGDLLGRIVFALTGDLELVGEAIEAFDEIQMTLGPQEPPPEVEPTPPEAQPPRRSELWNTDPDHEHLMLEMQASQKRLLDFGLATRVSIEMAFARTNRANVQQALRDMSELRHTLLRFEELLREAEERILEDVGILDKK